MAVEDGLLRMWEVVGSSPWGQVSLMLLHYILRVAQRENYGCFGTRVGGIGWSEMGFYLHQVWKKKITHLERLQEH